MKDLIDRQAAIEIVYRYNKSHMILQGKPMLGAASIVIELEALPSAQPTQNTRVNSNNSLDTISRQAAIEAILHNKEVYSNNFGNDPIDRYTIAIIDADVQAIAQLPSAQPERKKGKWVYAEDEYGIDGYHCNQCGFFVPWDYIHNFINYIEDYNFCPNCGADMRGEQNG